MSCEGSSGPGDSYVLKGTQSLQTHLTFSSISEYVPIVESCPLEYRPQEVPNVLRSPVLMTTRPSSYVHSLYRTDDPNNATAGILFLGVCIAVLAYTLYKYLLPCLEGDHRSSTSRTPRPGPSSGSGWFPGAMTITVVALRHLTQNIQTIPQSPPVRGGRIKTVWAFGAELRSAVWELTS